MLLFAVETTTKAIISTLQRTSTIAINIKRKDENIGNWDIRPQRKFNVKDQQT